MRDLQDLLSASRLEQARARRRAQRAAIEARGCLLFGPGTNGRQLAHNLQASPAGPVLHGFVSDVAADHGRVVEGLPVLSRAEALARFGAEMPVASCVYRADVTIAAVNRGLRESGFRQVFSLPETVAAFEGDLPAVFAFGGLEQVAAAGDAIAETDRLLADATSRDVFRSLIAQRISLDFSVERNVERGIYFPDFVHRSQLAPDGEPFVFVDCGAYVGDTLEQLHAWDGGRPIHAVALEPDPGSFKKLEVVASRLAPSMAVTCVQAAVGAADGRVGFLNLNNEASRVVADAETTVPVRAVDSVLHDFGLRASYVKYDIEGFEREGLAGADAAITQDRAGLAVSVYHRPGDLWEFAPMLHARQPAYRFYLREHGPDGMDTVLYALPNG